MDDVSQENTTEAESDVPKRRGVAGEDISLFITIIALVIGLLLYVNSHGSDSGEIGALLAGLLGLIALVAVVQNFRIARTLEQIREVLKERK